MLNNHAGKVYKIVKELLEDLFFSRELGKQLQTTRGNTTTTTTTTKTTTSTTAYVVEKMTTCAVRNDVMQRKICK